jgi:hypothetical protein
MIVTVPWVSAVVSPVDAPIVAICVLLVDQETWLVRFTVAPVDVVPIAMNCVVSPGSDTDCELGMMAMDVTLPEDVVPPPPDDAVTVTVALAVMVPVYPFMLAVIVAVPAVSAVASPVELTLATAGALEVHVAVAVTSDVVDGWPLPWPVVPVAVNCTVWPTVRDCEVGETARESTREVVQPAMGRTRAIRRSARGEKRSCMVDLRNLQPILTSTIGVMADSRWPLRHQIYVTETRVLMARRCYFGFSHQDSQ